MQIINRGKLELLSGLERHPLKRRHAIEPVIGCAKADHRMDRRCLLSAQGDPMHSLGCPAGCKKSWLPPAIARLGLAGLPCTLSAVVLWVL